LRTLLIFDLATRVNLSNKFIDNAVLEARRVLAVAVVIGATIGTPRRVNDEFIEKASIDEAVAIAKRAVWKFILRLGGIGLSGWLKMSA
jgi:hypothetical protein